VLLLLLLLLLLQVAAVDKPKLHMWETGIMRITRHPQAVGQAIWCAAHTLWIGNTFMLTTSAALLAHHLFGCWHGDQRLAAKYGEAFEEVGGAWWSCVLVLLLVGGCSGMVGGYGMKGQLGIEQEVVGGRQRVWGWGLDRPSHCGGCVSQAAANPDFLVAGGVPVLCVCC
jgi:hypothetical protein